MSPRSTLRAIAATVAGLANALPQPQAPETTVSPSPLVWVHVSATEHAGSTHFTTITPTPTVDANGAPTALSAPPDYLTASSVYTSLEGGTKPVTYTGVNPTPTGISQWNITGDYLACENVVQSLDDDDDKPLFCTPKRDTVLRPGKGYYIVWDPSYFAEPAKETVGVRIEFPQADKSIIHMDLLVKSNADRGFAYWYIDDSWWSQYKPWTFRERHNPTGVNISLILYNLDEVRSEKGLIPGPVVWVTDKEDLFAEDEDDWPTTPAPAPAPAPDSDMSSTQKTVAVAVPITFVGLLLLVIMYVHRKRKERNGTPTIHPNRNRNSSSASGSGPIPSNPPLSSGGGNGYGIRQSYSEHVGTAPGNTAGTTRVDSDPPAYEEAIKSGSGAAAAAGGGGGVDGGVFELTDRSSWSPPTRRPTSPPTYESDYSPPQVGRGNSNVFREELGRQQQQARQG
ncbi:hypothetical protein B0T09DRAFT_57560 [Sordaria sp. MPI-SDFR-AT-0083]|nr:hypothetical protein B0T09DRAFT_57560 [Sordaria sp. MPI-SDFR-AT-0083]